MLQKDFLLTEESSNVDRFRNVAKSSCRVMTTLNSLRYLVNFGPTDLAKSRNSHATDAAVTIRVIKYCLNSSGSSTATAKAIFCLLLWDVSAIAVLMYEAMCSFDVDGLLAAVPWDIEEGVFFVCECDESGMM